MAIDVKELYMRYGPMVNRRCLRLLGDKEEAADAMHDVFVQIVRRQEVLTSDAAPALLYRVATYVCLNRLRTRRRHPETRDERLLMMIASQEALAESTERKSILARIFGRERASTRVIAVLHYVDKMTLEEVARVVGLSVSGVRKRLSVLKERAKELEETDK